MECEDVRKEYPDKKIDYCCESCHEDDATGHGNDLWFDIDGKERHVCCAISKSFKNKEKGKE